MSPYIVTTKQPTAFPGDRNSAPLVLSRRAVATLEEAHETAREACLYVPGSNGTIARAIRDVFALPESGGTVGPLPDGTVIEVKPRSTDSLIAELAAMGVTHGPAGDVDLAVIAAFNARQSA